MNQRSNIVAFATVLMLAVLEAGFFNSLALGQYMIHPVLLYVILNRRTESLATRVALAAFGGILLDIFAPTPYGQWLVGLSLGVLATELIFTHWLSHRFWIAPMALTILGWASVRLMGIILNGSTRALTDWFSREGLDFWTRDLAWTILGVIVVTAIQQLIHGQRRRYASA